jgi:hypothetical protein
VRPRPTWSEPREAVALLLRGATAAAVWRVALAVGTVLSAANQGSVIVGGEATWATWARVAFNYLVPYVVASMGFLTACRVARDDTTRVGGTSSSAAERPDP